MTDIATPLPMLEKRRIEAAILGEVYHVLKERHGTSEAREIIGAAVIKSAVAQGQEFRDKHTAKNGTTDLTDLAALGAQWEMNGALKREVLVKKPDQYDFNMVHCAYAKMYSDMGLAEIGDLLSCNRDQTFCQGFNPDMELTVTQTIMQGADYCDFRYKMRSDK